MYAISCLKIAPRTHFNQVVQGRKDPFPKSVTGQAAISRTDAHGDINPTGQTELTRGEGWLQRFSSWGRGAVGPSERGGTPAGRPSALARH